jgi:hypothetical protein
MPTSERGATQADLGFKNCDVVRPKEGICIESRRGNLPQGSDICFILLVLLFFWY